MYGTKVNHPTSMLSTRSFAQDFSIRHDHREGLKLAAMDMKLVLDKERSWICFTPGDEVLLRLHKGYTLPADKVSKKTIKHPRLPAKLQAQYASPHGQVVCDQMDSSR